MEIYSDIITAYAKNPFNNFRMDVFTISHKEESRVCWDDIEVFLKIEDWLLKDYSFIWNTSTITKAAASVFWESAIWQKIEDIKEYKIDYIISLIWEVSPRRKYAATLWLLATRNAIRKYEWSKPSDDFSDVLE